MVKQLRLVVTTQDYERAVAFYRDQLGLTESAEYVSDEAGRVIILAAGAATLEISDVPHAEHVDDLEVGRRVGGHLRVAFEVTDAAATTARLAGAGATVVAPPTRTPWNSLNARLDGPAGLHLTVFQELPD